MKLISVPLFFVFCFSFHFLKAQTSINQKSSTARYSFSISTKKTEYGYEVVNIKVKNKKDGAIHQTINKPAEDVFAEDINMTTLLEVADVNFDGYPDITFPLSLGSRNTSYNIYVFEPKTQKFILNEVLVNTVGSNLTIDPKRRILKTSGVSGPGNWEWATYTVTNGSLILLENGTTDVKSVGHNDYMVEKTNWYDYDAATGKSFVVKQKLVDVQEVQGKVFTVEKYLEKRDGNSNVILIKEVRYDAGNDVQQTFSYDISKILRLKNLDSLFTQYKGQVDVSYQPAVEEFDVPEGLIYTLFKNTSDELHIVVTKEGKFLELFTESAKANKWKFPQGVRTGMSLQELAMVNTKPVNVSGFETDYSGQVNWNGGALANRNIYVVIGYAGNIPPEFIGDDANIRSDNPKVKGLKLFVQKISIRHKG